MSKIILNTKFTAQLALDEAHREAAAEAKEEKVRTIRSLMETLSLTAQEVMNTMKLPPDQQKELALLI